jgi:Putative transposase
MHLRENGKAIKFPQGCHREAKPNKPQRESRFGCRMEASAMAESYGLQRKSCLPSSITSVTGIVLSTSSCEVAPCTGSPQCVSEPAMAKMQASLLDARFFMRKDGLVRITLKCAFSDGTVAIDLDPLSMLSRLTAAVPYPRFHTVRCAGVLASASKLRPKIAPLERR